MFRFSNWQEKQRKIDKEDNGRQKCDLNSHVIKHK